MASSATRVSPHPHLAALGFPGFNKDSESNPGLALSSCLCPSQT